MPVANSSNITTIQILRSYSNTAPATLEDGQLAYSFVSNTLFIGSNTGVQIIGDPSTAIKSQFAYDQANTATVLAQASFDHANSGYEQANTGTVLAQASFDSANTKVSKSGDTMTGSLSFDDGQLAVGSVVDPAGIDLFANTGQQWARLNYANTNFVYVDGVGSYVYNGTGIPTELNLESGEIRLRTNGQSLLFNSNGQLIFPDSTIQTTAYTPGGEIDELARETANAAYFHANGAFIRANTAFDLANAVNIEADAAYFHANGAFIRSNSAYFHANGAFLRANAAFAVANTADVRSSASYFHANGAFIRANAAFTFANTRAAQSGYTANSVIIANTTGDIVSDPSLQFISSNSTLITGNIVTLGTGGNISNANNIFANNFVATFNVVSSGINLLNYTQAAFDSVNVQNSAIAATDDKMQSAYAHANNANVTAKAAFDNSNTKFSSSGGSITGPVSIINGNDLTVTGNLIVLGNVATENVSSFTVADPLIVLGTGNYYNDVKDIGFAAHYNNGVNAHTGLVRDSEIKEWIFFEGYTPELDANNNINIANASFAYANVYANWFKGNLLATTARVNGLDVYTFTTAGFNAANTAQVKADAAYVQANVTIGVDATQNTRLTVIEGVNDSQNVSITTQNSFISIIQGVDVGQNAQIAAANVLAQAAFDKANTGGAITGNVYISNDLSVANTITTNTLNFLTNTANVSLTKGTGISSWNYSGVFKSISTEESNPAGLFFSPDGLNMYVNGSTGDDVNQYTLSSAWNITTASYVRAFSTAAQDNSPADIFFKSDGLAMFIVGQTSDTVYQYTLSSAWDISTASYASKSFSITSQEGSPTGLWFKSDGTAMYIVGTTNDAVHQYTLGTPWDVSTASYASISFNVAAQESSPTQVNLSSDGTKMWVTGASLDQIHEYSLGTPWNISTATFTGSFYVGYQDPNPNGLFIDDTAPNRVYMVGTTNDTVFQFDTDTKSIEVLTDVLDIEGNTRISKALSVQGTAHVNGLLNVYGATSLGTTTINATLSALSAVDLTSSTTAPTARFATSLTTGNIFIGGPTQTGNLVFGYSSLSQTANIANGNTAAGSTKTLNLGTSAGPGSNTLINIGPTHPGANGNVTFNPATTVAIQNTRASISNTTGALTVLGGLGISGNVYADGIYDGGVEVLSYLQGVDNTQNTRLSVIEGTNLSQNVRLDFSNTRMTIIEGVNATQNTRLTVIEGTDASQNVSIATQNSFITVIQGVDVGQNSRMTIIEGVDTSQNARMTIIENTNLSQNVRLNFSNTRMDVIDGVNASQNVSISTQNNFITIIQGVDTSQNARMTIIEGVDAAQNTRLTIIENTNVSQNLRLDFSNTAINATDGKMQSAYNQANTGTTLAQAAFTQANVTIGVDATQNTRLTVIEGTDVSQNARMAIIEGVDVSQNTRMSVIEGVNASQNVSITTQNNFITIIQGVDVTQNAAIAATDNKMQSAYAHANNANVTAKAAFDNSNTKLSLAGGTITGNLTVSQDLTVSGNLYVAGNVSTVNTSSFAITDPMFILAVGNYFTDTKDIGFAAHYNDGANAHTGLIRDFNLKEWIFFQGYTPELDANNDININDPSFQYANVYADWFKGNVVAQTARIDGRDISNFTTSAFNQANTGTVLAQAAFTQANVTIGVDTTQNTRLTVIEGTDASQNVSITTQNNFITVIQGVDVGQNSRMTIIEGVNASQNVRLDFSNAAITIIQGVDATQNTAIAATNQYAQSGFSVANSAYGQANTATVLAQAAFDRANTEPDAQNYRANTILVANSAGFVSNSNAFFTASNNALITSGSALIGYGSTNYLQVTGNTTGNSPTISAQGSDTNIDINIVTKGTGNTTFRTDNGIGFRVYDNGSGTFVNYWQARGGSTGNTPVLWATGSDINVAGTITSGGTGALLFRTQNNGLDQFRVTHTASAVNYLQVTGSATANTPVLSAQGSDTNVSMSLMPKGTGGVLVNQTYNQNTVNVGSTLQVTGNVAANGALVAQNIYVQGGSNWLIQSANLQNAIWQVHTGDGGATTVTVNNTVAAPDGSFTAWQLNNSGGQTRPDYGIFQAAGSSSGPWIASVWLRAGSLSTARFLLSGVGDDTYPVGANVAVTLTTTWQRFVISAVTGPPFTTTSGVRFKLTTNAAAGNILVWGPQLELGNATSARNVASPYTPTFASAVVAANNNVYVTGNVAAANVIVSNVVSFANSNNIVAVYQTYNASTNSLDVVFG